MRALHSYIACLALLASCSTTTQSTDLTVGGTASGIKGSVVLSNGTAKLTVSKDGPFKFTQVYAVNQSYVVGIVSQPSTQLCTLENGVGTVGTASVDSIRLKCVTKGSTTGTGTTTGTTTGGPTLESFFVGGTVSGMEQGPITLQNAYAMGTDTLTIEANQEFAFPTRHAFGADYAVTITAQPPGQTCSVVQGQGTVAAANVTTVAIACTYSVGGTVQGLFGTLQLLNTTSDGGIGAVLVTQDGPFSFPALHNTDVDYTVTIAVQPERQVCTISNGVGALGSANVTDVTINCPPPSYTIGGTVSGLATGQVAIQVNSVQAVTVAQNGAFTIGSVPAGAAYTVTIKAQPQTKVCSVTQGIGTMPGRAVTDVQVTCGDRNSGSYSVGGTISGLVAGTSVSLNNGYDNVTASNGSFTMEQLVAAGTPYNVVVSAHPPVQQCAVTNPNGTMPSGNVSNIAVACVPYLRFISQQNASAEFGQEDFTGSLAQPTNANTISGPIGSPYQDGNGRIYFVDTLNNRVVGLHQMPTRSNMLADFVLGQPTLNSNSPMAARTGMAAPRGIGPNGRGLVIADANNNRVLLYSSAYANGVPQPAVVVGQGSFTSSSSGCSAVNLNRPSSAIVVGTRLIVADTNNHRVLIWSPVPTVSGKEANIVLGQSSLTTCTQNQGGGPRADTLSQPRAVWSDGNSLYVADTSNNRVIGWRSLSQIATSSVWADLLLGQAAFTENFAFCSSNGLGQPNGIASDGTQLFVSDGANSRIVIYSRKPTVTGVTPIPTAVLGQPSLINCVCNQGAPNVLCRPAGVTVMGSNLVVTDSGNNRYLFFASH